jgi:hypothetical protein
MFATSAVHVAHLLSTVLCSGSYYEAMRPMGVYIASKQISPGLTQINLWLGGGWLVGWLVSWTAALRAVIWSASPFGSHNTEWLAVQSVPCFCLSMLLSFSLSLSATL